MLSLKELDQNLVVEIVCHQSQIVTNEVFGDKKNWLSFNNGQANFFSFPAQMLARPKGRDSVAFLQLGNTMKIALVLGSVPGRGVNST